MSIFWQMIVRRRRPKQYILLLSPRFFTVSGRWPRWLKQHVLEKSKILSDRTVMDRWEKYLKQQKIETFWGCHQTEEHTCASAAAGQEGKQSSSYATHHHPPSYQYPPLLTIIIIFLLLYCLCIIRTYHLLPPAWIIVIMAQVLLHIKLALIWDSASPNSGNFPLSAALTSHLLSLSTYHPSLNPHYIAIKWKSMWYSYTGKGRNVYCTLPKECIGFNINNDWDIF